MEHPSIDEAVVPERYVAGKLSPEERDRFEEHFFDCAKCLEAVELVRRFGEDLRELPAAAFSPPRARTGFSGATILLAASFLAAVSAAVYFYRSSRDARRELDALHRPPPAAAPRERPTAASEASRTLASAPLAASVFTLNLTRGASAEPENRVSVGGSEHWMVLLFDEPDVPGPYRVMLARSDGTTVAGPLDAGAASDGVLAASFPSSLLPPGNYALIVGKGALAPPDRLATYRFRAAP
jgi:hypothetical protein